MNPVILQGFREQIEQADEVCAAIGMPDADHWLTKSTPTERESIARIADADLSGEQLAMRQLSLTRAGLSYLSAIAHLLLDQASRSTPGKNGES